MKQSTVEREIAAVLAERTGRPCLFVSSARLALYLALRTWLTPGKAILMSPINDDIILFVVLAAGLRPVMAPVSVDDGNIDVEAVPEDVWSKVSGVLTTNLYGLPDQMRKLRDRCDRRGIPLIEDAAHAIETTVGDDPLGTFGEASAFSFSKHVAADNGGVLAVADEARLPELEHLRDLLTVQGNARALAEGVLKPTAKRLVRQLRLTGPAVRAYRVLGLDGRPEFRLPLQASLLQKAVRGARERSDLTSAARRDVDMFDPWLRVDRLGYRSRLWPSDLRRILARLHQLPADQARRIEGVERLRELDSVAPAVRQGPALPLFRVPLLVADRNAVRAELERRGIVVGYIYDPPLDDYAGPAFVDVSPIPDPARWWARHALPVDPLDVRRVLDVLPAVDRGFAAPVLV
jgi:dTDP-4-amino-4,6-dideoxygalactose transaminase